jgi:uncharacterized GH25 family protein
MMRVPKAATLAFLLLLLGALSAQAHLSWIRAPRGPLQPGVENRITLDHGDVFPLSVGSLPLDYVRAFVVTPDGKSAPLALQEEALVLSTSFTPQKTGGQILHYTYHPGVMSKTEDGWHIGGADEYPVALDRLQGIQTAVAYLQPDARLEGAPLGLALELVPRLDGQDIELILLKDGIPYAGATVLHLPRGEEALPLGETDAEGRILFHPAQGYTGEVAFGVKLKLPMPAGAPFDRDVFFTTLVLDFR